MFKKDYWYMIFLIAGCVIGGVSWVGLEGSYIGFTEKEFNFWYNLSVAGASLGVLLIIIAAIGFAGVWKSVNKRNS